jgi:ubiquinone/menaquinone biosynthesis C-methylase UbiE
LKSSNLRGKKVLITSCAFGNVMPRVVQAAVDAGASEVRVVDIIDNELLHARSKLQPWNDRVAYVKDDATAMSQPEGFADANIMFFLLHELPHDQKIRALREAGRVLAPGGKLYLAEFGRPAPWILRALSWTYFTVFEPLGLALWRTHDPIACLSDMGGWQLERDTFLFGNFQVITATKLA